MFPFLMIMNITAEEGRKRKESSGGLALIEPLEKVLRVQGTKWNKCYIGY